jgi:nuclear cap-binding protein subunit 1
LQAVGLELVKIILLTIPYAMASSATGLEEKASELLEKTEIIASQKHPLEMLSDPYPGDSDERPFGFQGVIDLLQKQLQREAANGWPLRCIPRAYKELKLEKVEGAENGENGDSGENGVKPKNRHALPTVTVPTPENLAQKPLFPETFFSIYADLEVEVCNITFSIRNPKIQTYNFLVCPSNHEHCRVSHSRYPDR